MFKKNELNYEDALRKLEKEGRKGFNAISSALLGAGIGAAAGAAAASTIAGAVGLTSITGLTTAASWIGVTVVAATPVGLVVGSAVGLGAVGAGVAAWWNQRTVNAENARVKAEDIRRKIQHSLCDASSQDDNEMVKRAASILHTAYLQNLISEEHGKKLLLMMKEKKVDSGRGHIFDRSNVSAHRIKHI